MVTKNAGALDNTTFFPVTAFDKAVTAAAGGRCVHIREARIEAHLYAECESRGLRCLKFIPDHAQGMPDRLVLLPDRRVVWVETKAEGGRLSAIQKYRHRQLRLSGHEVVVLWSIAQVDAFIADIERAAST